MIETHAHLNFKQFNQDLDQVINAAFSSGVEKIIIIGIDKASSVKAIKIAEKYENVYATVGLHPGDVEKSDTSFIEPLLNHHKVVAIGECGTDLYWTKDTLEIQQKYLHKQAKIALKYNLPLIIHTRNSFNEAYEIIKDYTGVKGVFHCFSSNLEDAKKVIDLGFYIGIDGPVTFNKATELHEIVKEIDLKHLLIETDSPYLAPAPYRGKRNEPKHLLYIAQKIADIKNISVNEVIKQTTINANNLFNFGGKS
jgi:TatD DNase family protein